MIFEFPNSPGIEVHVDRGGRDPITGEQLSEKYVLFNWTDEDGIEQSGGFIGP